MFLTIHSVGQSYLSWVNFVNLFPLQGDLDKQREGVVFLTIHDVGQSYLSWVNFVNIFPL